MIDNGYIFAKNNNRIFLNTSLGCSGGCCYCYLSKLGYNNENNKPVTAEYVLDLLNKSDLKITNKTLITIGCYSECWDDKNKPQTIKLIKHFLELGNQIQLSTKKQVTKEDLSEILPLIKYYGQLVIFVSCATISMHNYLEKNTTPVESRFNTFKELSPLNVVTVLYIKPILKNITIKDLESLKKYIEQYKIKDVVVGSIFTTKESSETVPFSNSNQLFYNEVDDEQIMINELSKLANVFKRSSLVMKKYKKDIN